MEYKKAPGQMVIISLIFLTVVMVLTGTLFGRTASFLRFGGNSLRDEQAINLAEAGVDYAIWQLNKTAGTCGAIEGCGVEKTLGTIGSFIVTIQEKTPPNSQLKTIISTSYVPDATNPRSKKTIKTDVAVSTESISFRYALQVGNGGVFMENSSRINGTVWSNANIDGQNSSLIDGEANAVGSISDPPCTPPSCTAHPNEPSPPPMPTLVYNDWREAACPGGSPICTTTCSPTCVITTNINIGPRKYVGNLEISGTATVTVDGPIYVTGNLDVKNSAQVNLNTSLFGSSGTVIIVDGTVTVQNTAAFNPTTADPKGYILVASAATSSTTTYFYDTFTDSNKPVTNHTPNTGTGWTQPVSIGTGTAYIDNNQLFDSNPFTNDIGFVAIANDVPSSPNYQISVKVAQAGSLDSTITLVARWIDANNTYAWMFSSTAGPSWNLLLKRVSGTWTTLSSSCGSVTSGNTATLEVNGTSIRALKNGVQVCSATDGSLTAAGKGGIGHGAFYDTTDDLTIQRTDDFKIESLAVSSNPVITIKNLGVNAIFYALDGKAQFENNSQVTTVVARQLHMKNSATLTYQQGLANTQFSSGPGGSWTVKKGTYRFTSGP